jgi:hypothetical protein
MKSTPLLSGVFSNSSALTFELRPASGRWLLGCCLLGAGFASVLLVAAPLRPWLALAHGVGSLWICAGAQAGLPCGPLHLLAPLGDTGTDVPLPVSQVAAAPTSITSSLRVSRRTLVAPFGILLCARAEGGALETWWLWRADYSQGDWRRLQVFLRWQCG